VAGVTLLRRSSPRVVWSCSANTTYALRAADGTKVWAFGVPSVTAPAIGPDGTIYISAFGITGMTYALRA
jgi:outer membrane protein assembly factor BamB